MEVIKMANVSVNAKWNGIERKVTYSASFVNVKTGKLESIYDYISKSALYEDMKLAGATPQQIKEAKAIAKTINASAYRR